MGFLNRAKHIEVASPVANDVAMKPRFSSFMFSLSSFLENIGAEYGAFLIKKGSMFYVACPVGLDTQTFNRTTFDASVVMKRCDGGDNIKSFITFTSTEEQGSLHDLSLLDDAVLYPMDENNCVFLLWKFEDTSVSPLKTGKIDILVSAVETFKNEYRANEVMVATCLPPLPKYVGFSSIESKLEGSSVASKRLNFITFSFEDIFDLCQLEDDIDSLVMFYSLVNRILLLIGKTNFAVLQKDFSLKTCIFSSQLLDREIYATTIKTVLSSIYASSLVEKIKIIFMDNVTHPKDEVLAWLENVYSPISE